MWPALKGAFWAQTCVVVVTLASVGCGKNFRVQTLANLPVVTAGLATTCVMDPTRKLVCYGQSVGDGLSSFTAHTTPYVNDILGRVSGASLGKGTNAGCAIRDDGTSSVACWGYQLLSPSNYGLPKKVVPVPGVTGATAISVGGFGACRTGACAIGACAIGPAGAVTCWRFNSTSDDPVGVGPVPGLPAATAISVGDKHACIVDTVHAVYCWGSNADGQIGNGSRDTDSTSDVPPTQVPGIQALDVSAGEMFTCALLMDRTVSCWGYNGYGELGVNPLGAGGAHFPSPRAIPGLSNVTALSAGDSFACAVRSDRSAWCWGDNNKGQLGVGLTPQQLSRSASPLQVFGITTATRVSAADHHACVSGLGGMVKCWGKNTSGELTDGTMIDSAVPVP